MPLIRTTRNTNTYIALTPHQREVLDGEMLGDGCLFRRRETANAHAAWTLRSHQHVTLLAEEFAEYEPRVRNIGDTKRQALRTLTNPALTEQRMRWYPDGRKRLPADLTLSPIVCLHWFIGDGANRGRGSIRFHTESFTELEVERLVRMLGDLGFPCAMFRRSSNHGRGNRLPYISMRTQPSLAFLDYIGPCTITDYAHRWKRGVRRVDYSTNPRGSANGSAKLTEEIVTTCRWRYTNKIATPTQMAREFGVSDTSMFMAIKGETWKHVPML
jgi:hypothetical protein